MSEQLVYLLPVIGVFLGWLLREISYRFKQKREDKKEIRRITYLLFQLQLRLDIILPVLTEANDNDLEVESEDELENVLTKKARNNSIFLSLEAKRKKLNDFLPSLRSTIEIISTINPFLALSLDNMINNKTFLEKTYKPDNSEITKINLCLLQVQCEEYAKLTRKIIMRILWKVDKINFIKFYFSELNGSVKSRESYFEKYVAKKLNI